MIANDLLNPCRGPISNRGDFATIVSGTAIQMTATGTYSDGSTQNLTSQVSWSCLNTAAARLSPFVALGLVRYKGGPSSVPIPEPHFTSTRVHGCFDAPGQYPTWSSGKVRSRQT